MHDIHAALDTMDLNLLVTLDALLIERHVTRAARRLGRTQSATSHALARLRDVFQDPLLVRGPGGTLRPTPRAELLAPTVHRALGDLAEAVRKPIPFDPLTARRTFRLGTHDFGQVVLLPELTARLTRAAPKVDLRITTEPAPSETAAAVASGEVDVVLGPPRSGLAAGCYQRVLFDERFTCVVRRGHPVAGRSLTLARFCELDHLLISPRGTPGGFVDDALAALRRSRRVAVTVPHFLMAPHLVARTDLILTLPSRLADLFARQLELLVLPPPLEIPGFSMSMTWHERTQYDAGHRWFRDQLVAVAAPLDAGER